MKNYNHYVLILDTKYKETPKRRSIVLEEREEEESVSLEQTKEYDINVISEKFSTMSEHFNTNEKRELIKIGVFEHNVSLI